MALYSVVKKAPFVNTTSNPHPPSPPHRCLSLTMAHMFYFSTLRKLVQEVIFACDKAMNGDGYNLVS